MPTIKNHKKVQKKSRTHEVKRFGAHKFRVISGESGKTYWLYWNGKKGTCSCEWGNHRPLRDIRSACGHALAVAQFVEQEKGRTSVSSWGSEEDAQRQHRPCWFAGDNSHLTSRK